MIVAKEFKGKVFESKDDLFKALKDNKSDLYAQKKMSIKYCDAIFSIPTYLDEENKEVSKEVYSEVSNINKLNLELAINTTGLMDSHNDVHIKGLWTKSLKENKTFYLLQEHQMTFDKIIGTAKGSVINRDWSVFGQGFKGETQALVFNSTIEKERNPFMFEQYAKGFVKEHSVGMQYVKYELAINSDDAYYKAEKKIFDKYIDSVVNKENAEQQGYFFAVTEAKIIEGSAVVKGSNFATPTLSVEAVEDTSTKSEPSNDTQIDYDYLIKNLNN